MEHDQPDHEGMYPASKRRTSKKLRLQSGYCEYKMKALLIKVGFCDVLVWSLDTNEVREVSAMSNSHSIYKAGLETIKDQYVHDVVIEAEVSRLSMR